MDDKTQLKSSRRGPNRNDNRQMGSHSEQDFAQSQQTFAQTPLDDQATQIHRSNQSSNMPYSQSAQSHASQGKGRNQFEHIDRARFSGGDNHGLSVIDIVTPLLSMAGRLKSAESKIDLHEFKRYAINQIKHYDSLSFGLSNANSEFNTTLISYARYGLCALIDELIQNTPWGQNNGWAQQSLSSIFFRETLGGEEFFNYLEQMKQQPAQCLPVLSFYYACLDLGFLGRYRDTVNGHDEYYKIKEDLFILIDRQTPRIDQSLSPHWKGASEAGRGIIKHIPLPVIGAVTLGIGLLIYIGFYFTLVDFVKPVNLEVVKVIHQKPLKVQPRNFNRLGQSTPDIAVVDAPVAVEPDLAPVTLGYQDNLRALLSSEIAKGTVVLKDNEDEIIIRLAVVDRELFASASAQLADEYVLIVDKIGEFLIDSPVEVTVTGHSDNLPMRSSIKYPDNLSLSQARADKVSNRLMEKSGRDDIKSYGVADAFPVSNRNDKQGRRQNRRVEISLNK